MQQNIHSSLQKRHKIKKMYKKDKKEQKKKDLMYNKKKHYVIILHSTHQDKSLNWCGMCNLQLCHKCHRTELYENISNSPDHWH